jgi:hypothetical protein
LIWDEVSFISDAPGKNANEFELDGSGEATDKLIELLQTAKESVLNSTRMIRLAGLND